MCLMLTVCLLFVVQGAKAASGRDLNTDASLKESDVLPEKLRLIWVCCAHAAVTAAVLAAPSAASQALPRSILQESHWRHTHPQVKPCSGFFKKCSGGSLPISIYTGCASFAAACRLCRTTQPDHNICDACIAAAAQHVRTQSECKLGMPLSRSLMV